ncbi:integumentary mucin C.1-like [Bufo gargarizans]|uniref:integumentary mucin C.1-like n=1 Tax=Bufo gargarizans TaxID=30331 RepID=UPI001CF43C1A|nr:integumentary mucin C.1-like [Bufo gargarizans]
MGPKLLILLAVTLIQGQLSLAKPGHKGSKSNSHSEEDGVIKECNVAPEDRRDCGNPWISADEGAKRRCCFDSSIPEVNWCFFSKDQDKAQCSASPKERKDCGFLGISAKNCYSRGCCFDSSFPEINWFLWLFFSVQRAPKLCLLEMERCRAGYGGTRKDTGVGDQRISPAGREEAFREKKDFFQTATEDKEECGCYSHLWISWLLLGSQKRTFTAKSGNWLKKTHNVSKKLRNRCSRVIAPKGCKVATDDRRDCGYPGISAAECAKRRCCFDSSIPEVKWCFFSKEQDKAQCSARPKERKDCGFLGISAKDCYSRGCCFDSSVPEINWCFFPQFKGCNVSHKLRNDCGYPNISAKDCYSRGCCYDSSIPETVWCFYGYK